MTFITNICTEAVFYNGYLSNFSQLKDDSKSEDEKYAHVSVCLVMLSASFEAFINNIVDSYFISDMNQEYKEKIMRKSSYDKIKFIRKEGIILGKDFNENWDFFYENILQPRNWIMHNKTSNQFHARWSSSGVFFYNEGETTKHLPLISTIEEVEKWGSVFKLIIQYIEKSLKQYFDQDIYIQELFKIRTKNNLLNIFREAI